MQCKMISFVSNVTGIDKIYIKNIGLHPDNPELYCVTLKGKVIKDLPLLGEVELTKCLVDKETRQLTSVYFKPVLKDIETDHGNCIDRINVCFMRFCKGGYIIMDVDSQVIVLDTSGNILDSVP